MQKVKVLIKSKYGKDHLIVNTADGTELLTEGSSLTGIKKNKLLKKQPYKPVLLPIPDSIDTIESYAFRSWDSIQSVCFRRNPYKMGAGVFSGCRNLVSVTLPTGLDRIPMETFSGCEKLTTAVLPATVTQINMDAFKNCVGLKQIKLPHCLRVIELYAFWGCRSLTEIYLPDWVIRLKEEAFGSCTSLRKVRLSPSLEEIGRYAFMNCTQLEEIVIPPGVTELPIGVFAWCKNLKRIVLPDSIQTIHPYAFYRCDQLEAVEHPHPDRFSAALEQTPFWQNRHPDIPIRFQLPMELLNPIAGEISGTILTAMGYHWFETDRKYRIFPGKRPGVFEVRSRFQDPITMQWFNDLWLMDNQLEPLPGIQALLRQSDEEIWQSGDFWETQLETAAYNVGLYF